MHRTHSSREYMVQMLREQHDMLCVYTADRRVDQIEFVIQGPRARVVLASTCYIFMTDNYRVCVCVSARADRFVTPPQTHLTRIDQEPTYPTQSDYDAIYKSADATRGTLAHRRGSSRRFACVTNRAIVVWRHTRRGTCARRRHPSRL